ncbi:MAG: hypothetical protein LBQ22_12810 [Bacteroidales bacterium]|jgi:hypothetical protein|nr:hypothetical protein [Bacteroidales bacterium]
MNISKKLINTFLITGLVILLTIFFSRTGYIRNEGFNPTDEGVVIAQSWRVINGEIPHKDFISIRPAGSGIFHTIDFIFPGSLVENSRWIVLFQYFVIALCVSLLFYREINKKYNIYGSPVILVSMIIAGFTLTVLNYNLFPWTTVDALFWTSIALPLIFSDKNKLKNYIGLILLAFAALSRQTFLLISLLGNCYIIYQYRKEFIKSIPVILIGLLPYIGYFLMLFINNGLSDFIIQMSGRSEFFRTAILKFGSSFFKGYAAPFNFVIIFISVLLIIRKKHNFIEMFVNKGLHAVVSIIYIILAVIMIVRHFLAAEFNAYGMPFEIFFILLTFIFFHYSVYPFNSRIRTIAISILLISWVSAISLGANTPVFSVGLMFITLVSLVADILLEYPFEKIKIIENKYIILIISVGLFIVGYFGQQNNNYRDNKPEKLVYGLNYASPEFGKIKTNHSMVAYYSDLKDIYSFLDNAENNTVVFPCNAIFYPVMKTKNPMSLDWLNPYEYTGQEERIKKDLLSVIYEKDVYFIVDKIDVRIINNKIKPMVYNTDIVYDIIRENCKKIEMDSDFFEIYKSF